MISLYHRYMHRRKVINRYWLILVVEMLLMMLASVMDKHHSLMVLFVLGMVLLVLITIEICLELRFMRNTSIILGTIAIASGLIWFTTLLPMNYAYAALIISCSSFALFYAIGIAAIGRHVFLSTRATLNTIVGSACIYLLIGICFAFVYTVLSLSMDGIFYVDGDPLQVGIQLGNVGFKEFLYFSFSSLTTTGYGDIVPKDPLTRLTSYFECIAGSLYLAIVVAKLVGMYVTQKKQPS